MQRPNGIRFFLALVILGVPLCSAAAEPSPPRTISVTGHGEVSVPPDLAIVTFAVETTAERAGAAAESNARLTTAVTAALKERLGERDEIRTTGYSLDPFYQPRERASAEGPKIGGYTARNQVQVETAKLDGVGALIDAAIGAGANRVNGLQFTLDDPTGSHRDALRLAGEEAKRQAESIAAALGVKLGRVASASTIAPPVVQARRYEGFAMAAEARVETPVESGDVTVTATLQVTYEIE